MVALSETASMVIRRLVEDSEDGATGLRIMVEQGGCAGLRYMLGLETSAQAGEEVYEFDGARIHVVHLASADDIPSMLAGRRPELDPSYF